MTVTTEIETGLYDAGPDEQPAFAKPDQARRLLRGVGTYCCLLWILITVVVAATAQWLPVRSYVTLVGKPNQGPQLTREFLGTDSVGRSLVSRLCFGDRVSILISFSSTAIAMAVGILLGLLAIYFGKVTAWFIDVLINAVLSIPSLLLLLAIVLVMGPTFPTLIGALSLTFVPMFTRLTRANALAQMKRDYVIAARAMGASGRRLMMREVLPNTFPPLLSYAILVLPAVIVTEGSLSFLGFGVQAPVPSWGAMIAAAQPTLAVAYWPVLIPCLALFFTVYSLNTLGDAVRARLDLL